MTQYDRRDLGRSFIGHVVRRGGEPVATITTEEFGPRGEWAEFTVVSGSDGRVHANLAVRVASRSSSGRRFGISDWYLDELLMSLLVREYATEQARRGGGASMNLIMAAVTGQLQS